MAHTLFSTGTPAHALSRVRDLGIAFGAAVNAFVNRQEAGRAFARFDERMLRDIGLTPNDIGSAFSEPLWRDPTRRLAVIAIERRAAQRAVRASHQQAKTARVAELIAE